MEPQIVIAVLAAGGIVTAGSVALRRHAAPAPTRHRGPAQATVHLGDLAQTAQTAVTRNGRHRGHPLADRIRRR